MCVILAWFLSPRPKQTEWCHDPQPSQPTEDITAVLDSSMARLGCHFLRYGRLHAGEICDLNMSTLCLVFCFLFGAGALAYLVT